MMLDTSTRSPPSGAAMLPQKFSAATTFGRSSPPELPEPVEHAARPATASNATPIAMDLRALVITSVPHRAPTCIDRNKSRSHCQKKDERRRRLRPFTLTGAPQTFDQCHLPPRVT